MFRSTAVCAHKQGYWGGGASENWRMFYHRLRVSRKRHLDHHVSRLEAQKAAAGGATLALPGMGDAAAVSTPRRPAVDPTGAKEEPYRYNRWWVNNEMDFIHQYAYIEDPAITHQRRTVLPPATTEAIWRKPHEPVFLPMVPFVKVVDYAKDPDAKNTVPFNIPRWKDYMVRSKPMVPRTWY